MLRPRRLAIAAAIQIATLSTLNAARRGWPNSANIGTKPVWAAMPTQATFRMTAAMRGGGVTIVGMPAVTRLIRGEVAAGAGTAACCDGVDTRRAEESDDRGEG